MTCSNFQCHNAFMTASRCSRQRVYAARTAAATPDFYRERLTVGLSSTYPESTPEDVHGSESVECDSLCLPHSPGPSSHHRAGNAIPIPKAGPHLAFEQQPGDLGNAGTASWHLQGSSHLASSSHIQGASLRGETNDPLADDLMRRC